MQLTVAIIIGNLIFQVTHIEALNEIDSYNWHNFTAGDNFLSQSLGVVKSENCFHFKSYDTKDFKVVLTYDPLLAADVNSILSKCTCVGIN